mmetsp:Transcript_13355/g.31510  ORF Transcript_13355/g.31510 Transcript_13355/m.31510 type:complete len:317 (-) Transcript_13355:2367-3317(-)
MNDDSGDASNREWNPTKASHPRDPRPSLPTASTWLSRQSPTPNDDVSQDTSVADLSLTSTEPFSSPGLITMTVPATMAVTEKGDCCPAHMELTFSPPPEPLSDATPGRFLQRARTVRPRQGAKSVTVRDIAPDFRSASHAIANVATSGDVARRFPEVDVDIIEQVTSTASSPTSDGRRTDFALTAATAEGRQRRSGCAMRVAHNIRAPWNLILLLSCSTFPANITADARPGSTRVFFELLFPCNIRNGIPALFGVTLMRPACAQSWIDQDALPFRPTHERGSSTRRRPPQRMGTQNGKPSSDGPHCGARRARQGDD